MCGEAQAVSFWGADSGALSSVAGDTKNTGSIGDGVEEDAVAGGAHGGADGAGLFKHGQEGTAQGVGAGVVA